MKIKLLLVDDHALVRSGVRSLLSQSSAIGQIKEASNGQEAVKIASDFKPDVIVMDYEMPNFNGIYATREIVNSDPDAKIIMVSAYLSRNHIIEGVQAGIRGFLPKEAKTSELVEAIEALTAGEIWFKGVVAELIAPLLVDWVKNGHRPRVNSGLTKREKEIVSLLAGGFSPKAIADRLSISKRTVDVHKSNVFKKLKINSITELLRCAVRQGLVKI